MKQQCPICFKKINFINGKVKLKENEVICGNCAIKAHLVEDGAINQKLATSLTLEDVVNRINTIKKRNEVFEPSLKIADYIWFDDESQQLLIEPKKKKNDTIAYNDIIDFKIIEDNNVITKSGAASAIGGGLMFGPAGAIVGGLFSRGKKKKELAEKIQIILILKNNSTREINFLETKTKKESFIYKVSYDYFLKAGAKIEHLIDCNVDNTISLKQQLLELKELLDLEIITQEEFDKKKQELLK